MGEGSKMKNNIANTEKEAKMDKGVKMKKTAKAKAWVKHAGKARVAAVVGAVVALLFAGSLTTLATWDNQGVKLYDGKTAEVEEPAIIVPIDTRVDGRLQREKDADGNGTGTKQPGTSAYTPSKKPTEQTRSASRCSILACFRAG